MDWTPEDTEVLQIMNRCRQLMNKVNPVGYQEFATSDRSSRMVSCNTGGFEVELWESKSRFVATILDWRNSDDHQAKVFNAYTEGASRPQYDWDRDIVRNKVIPAMDREMILDDLSLLGRDS